MEEDSAIGLDASVDPNFRFKGKPTPFFNLIANGPSHLHRDDAKDSFLASSQVHVLA